MPLSLTLLDKEIQTLAAKVDELIVLQTRLAELMQLRTEIADFYQQHQPSLGRGSGKRRKTRGTGKRKGTR